METSAPSFTARSRWFLLTFVVASRSIKHTIPGAANITDEVSSIRNLMNMNYDIKR